MPGSGTENRQRQIVLKARFTEDEAALIRAQADRAGVSVASVIRYAVLNQKPLRASRSPTVDHEQLARLIMGLGVLATNIRDAADKRGAKDIDDALEAGMRDLAELRWIALEAMGLEP